MKKIFTLMALQMMIAMLAMGQLSQPYSAVWDHVNSVYLISSFGSGEIFEMQTNGTIASTFYNGGLAMQPMAMAISGNNVYIWSESMKQIQGYQLSNATADGTFNIFAFGARHMTADNSGNLYMTASFDNAIYKVDIAGNQVTTLATGLTQVSGIVYDATNNRLIVGYNAANSDLDAVDPSSGAVTNITSTTIDNIEGMSFDPCGRLYVASSGDNNVYRFDNTIANPTSVSSGHNNPRGITYSADNGQLIVPNHGSVTVSRVSIAASSATATINTSDTSVCEGTTFNLNGTTAGGTVLWTSTPSATLGSPSADITSFDPGTTTGTFNVKLTVTPTGGCPPASDSITVTVVASPTADAGAPLLPICGGCTNITGAGSGGDISWDDGGVGGTFTPNNANATQYCPPAQFSGMATLTQTVTDVGGVCNAANSSVSLTVSVPPTASVLQNDTTICSGSTLNLMGDSSNATMVQWATPSGATLGTPTNINTSFDPGAMTGAMTVYLTALGDVTCLPAVDSVLITVNAGPVADAGGPYNNVCQGGSIMLSGNGSNGNILWDDGGVGGTFTPNNANTSQYDPPVGYTGPITFKQTVSDPGMMCPNAVSTTSIQVMAQPTAAVMNGDTTICSSETLQLTGMPANEDSVMWTSAPTATLTPDNQNTATFTPPGAGSFVVTFTAYGAAGCTPANDMVTITVDASPDNAAITSGDMDLCDETSASLVATAPSVGTGMWSVESGTGTFADASAASTMVSGLANGANVMRWTVSNANCTPSFDEVTINTGISSTAGFSYTTSGMDATFTNTSTDATSWAWDFGDGQTSSMENPGTITYTAANDYTVCLITSGDPLCPADTTCQTVSVISSMFEPVQATFQIAPNPSNGVCFLQFNQWDQYTIEVLDALGKRVQVEQLQGTQGHLDLRDLATGVYIMKARGTGSVNYKAVKLMLTR